MSADKTDASFSNNPSEKPSANLLFDVRGRAQAQFNLVCSVDIGGLEEFAFQSDGVYWHPRQQSSIILQSQLAYDKRAQIHTHAFKIVVYL